MSLNLLGILFLTFEKNLQGDPIQNKQIKEFQNLDRVFQKVIQNVILEENC